MKLRRFYIYTAERRHEITAPSLRTALRNCEINERETPILAAVDAECIPKAIMDGQQPFFIAVLANPSFQRPQLG